MTGAGFVLLLGEQEAALRQVLNRAATELAALRRRVVHVSAKEPAELSLHDMVLQLSEQVDPEIAQGDVLERSHRLLTEADASCDRIILLISHAHLLTSSALRFLQLTCRSGPSLNVVLASTPSGAAKPVAPEFAVIQARSTRIELDPPPPGSRDRGKNGVEPTHTAEPGP